MLDWVILKVSSKLEILCDLCDIKPDSRSGVSTLGSESTTLLTYTRLLASSVFHINTPQIFQL